jgi:hypothetical protein
MAGKSGKRLAIHVCSEVRAYRLTALLAHILRPVLGIEMRHLVEQDLDLLGGKQAREEEIAVAVKLFDLLWCELHRVSLASPVSSCVPCRRPLTRPRAEI